MTGQVLFNGDQSDPFKVSNKVKQGCVLAPILFNLLFTCILRQAMQDFEGGCTYTIAMMVPSLICTDYL